MEIKELENKIINADCLDILKQLPDKCVDLVLTDPPYGIGFGTFNRTNKLKNGQRIKADKYKNSDWDSQIPDEDIFKEILRVSKNQIIWGGNYFPCLWVNGCRGFIFWKKNNPCKNFGAGELAYTSFDENCKCYDYNYFGNIEGGVWQNPKFIQHKSRLQLWKNAWLILAKKAIWFWIALAVRGQPQSLVIT